MIAIVTLQGNCCLHDGGIYSMNQSEQPPSSLIRQLEDILRENDPLCLIKSGAPDSEYDCEVPELVQLLRSVTDEAQLRKELHPFISARFGTDAYWIDYTDLARDLWTA